MEKNKILNFEKKYIDIFLISIAFSVFFLVSVYNLMKYGLWFDESVEYYFSKYLTGYLPFPSGHHDENLPNMYKRVVSTFQPPLYNFLMFFWLKIFDKLSWFRFFGVVTGFIGAIGIYKSAILLLRSNFMAGFSVFLYSFLPVRVQYTQEAAEYTLVLCFIPWLIYFFISLLENWENRNVILFMIMAVLCLYSQYGTLFAVLSTGTFLLVKVCLMKNKTYIICFLISAITAMIPVFFLWHFFIRFQLSANPPITNLNLFKISLNTFSILASMNGISFSNFSFLSEIVSKFNILFYPLTLLFYVIFGKKKILKMFCVCSFFTIFLMNIFVFFEKYNNNLVRYNLYALPILFLSSFSVLCMFILFIKESRKCLFKNILVYFISPVFLFLVICIFQNFKIIENNWNKDNIDEVVSYWINNKLYEEKTLIDCRAQTGFHLYLTHDKNYQGEMLCNIVWQEKIPSFSIEYEEEFLRNSLFVHGIPDKLFFITDHVSVQQDLECKIEALNRYYSNMKIIFSEKTRAMLFEFCK